MSLRTRFPTLLPWDTAPTYLIDGSAFIYRGFYAQQTMQRSDGFPTSAIYIVARIILRLLREESPKYGAFILDGKGKHFRHELFPMYKAQRKATPEGLIQQIEPIKRLIGILGMHLEVSEGCEADDCIASITKRLEQEHPVVIVGTDKDLRQCLTKNVIMWDPATQKERLVSLQSFMDDTGLRPDQWPDLQAIIGDTSDNIPGIPGIGIKTASKLFKDFSSLEDIRDNEGKLPPALAKKFAGHIEAMFLYRDLTRLSTDCCQSVELETLRIQPLQAQVFRNFLREFELSSLERELATLIKNGQTDSIVLQTEQTKTEQAKTSQTSLFDTSPKNTAPTAISLDLAQMPSCAGKAIAIMCSRDDQDNPFLLGLDAKEYRVQTSTQSLVTFLKDAASIITPSYKTLLHMHDAWQDIAPERFFDLSLATYLIDPEERDYAWPRLVAQWADICEISPANPALLALAITEHLTKRLQGGQLMSLMHELELPLVPVLVHMEKAGICLDVQHLQAFMRHVQNALDASTKAIYELAGGEFNIRSAQQLGDVLYKQLQIPIAKKTPGGQHSTAHETLEKLKGEHPIIERLLQFRKLEKLRSTYLEPLPRYINQQGYTDNRLHTTLNQLATATGRLSSSHPNLQNIPIRGEMGQRMRTCFTAPEGYHLVAADYSQIELRVLAQYTQDPTLLAAFHDDADIHTRTAALLYHLPEDSISPDQRRAAKTINFGLIYGMGANKLANELGISTKEAKTFIERYFEGLQAVKSFYTQVEETAREQGYITTIAGRRRLLQGLDAENPQAQALAKRQAINTLIQGSAADIIKWAMLAVYHDAELKKLGARLLLQVHDELLFEVPIENAQIAGERIAALMTHACPAHVKMDVALKTAWGAGLNWGLAH